MEKWRGIADRVIRAVLDAADAGKVVRRAWEEIPAGPLLVLSIGKASIEMAAATHDLLADREYEGIVTAVPERLKQASVASCASGSAGAPGTALGPRWRVFPCDHPLATQRNLDAASFIESRMRQFASRNARGGQVLVLISGGGSAHLTLPAEGVSLGAYIELQRRLMLAGATIDDLNAVRKHAERLKGGRLAEIAASAHTRALVISDVIDDPLDVIASGPLSPDPTTFADAIGVIKRFDLMGVCPQVDALLSRGEDGQLPETPKAGAQAFVNVEARIIASNALAVHAAACAIQSGACAPNRRTGVVGEARQIARDLVDALAGAQLRDQSPACMVWGGEPTVDVGNSAGRGGPSQEVALAGAIELERRGMEDACVIAFSTDGIDGPTDIAGGIADAALCRQLRAVGRDPSAMLATHESASALELTSRAIRTGPTGTNVNHVFVAMSKLNP